MSNELILESCVLECLRKKYTAACLAKTMPQVRESLNKKCRDLKKFSKMTVKAILLAALGYIIAQVMLQY